MPYAGFPVHNSLNTALYPFPQYGGITDTTSPTGDSKYDALQITATKRFSHGLQAGGTYTWGGGYVRPNRQNFFNPTGNMWQIQQIPVEALNFNAIYTVPSYESLPKAAQLGSQRLAGRLVRKLPERPVPDASHQPTL